MSKSEEAIKNLFNRRCNALEDDNARLVALRAMTDAVKFLDVNSFPVEPYLMMSEEGLVMMQWQTYTSGFLVLFVGDGSVSYSTSDQTYSSNMCECKLNDKIIIDKILEYIKNGC